MKRNIFILSIALCILIVSSTFVSASGTIDVKDYIKGKFPVIFNIYLSSLGELDEYEEEFIDLLQNLPEEEQKNFAKEVYENGFSKEALEKIRTKDIITKPETEIEEKDVEETLVLNTGKWIYGKTIDPIDDTTIIRFMLYSDSGKSIYDDPFHLVLIYRSGKKSGKTRLYVNWHNFLGISDDDLDFGKKVIYRFEDEKAKTDYWGRSTDYRATFYATGFLPTPKTKSTIKFIQKLMEIDSFTIRVTPYNEAPSTAVFDTRGLRNAVEQFNDILHWIED